MPLQLIKRSIDIPKTNRNCIFNQIKILLHQIRSRQLIMMPFHSSSQRNPVVLRQIKSQIFQYFNRSILKGFNNHPLIKGFSNRPRIEGFNNHLLIQESSSHRKPKKSLWAILKDLNKTAIDKNPTKSFRT